MGDRVIVSAVITCGECEYCEKEQFSLCDRTNPSKTMESMYGHRTAGLFGYSHLTGGYAGGQAEFVRVPLADNNLLVVTNKSLKDEQLILLSDIACTGWHANELANVSQGDKVAIWGAGPVGLMACMWAFYRGASEIILVDGIEYRLARARDAFLNVKWPVQKSEEFKSKWKTQSSMESTLPKQGISSTIASTEPTLSSFGEKTTESTSIPQTGYVQPSDTFIPKFHTVNYNDWKSVDGGVVKAIQQIMPGGPDCCLECVGFRFPQGFLHTLERTLGLETDSPQVLNDIIFSIKKGGRIGVVGDYLGYCNHFAIGAFMEKGLSCSCGQVFVQKYWKKLLEIFESGALPVDPTFVITHEMGLNEISKAYHMFSNYEDESIKIVLKPEYHSM